MEEEISNLNKRINELETEVKKLNSEIEIRRKYFDELVDKHEDLKEAIQLIVTSW